MNPLRLARLVALLLFCLSLSLSAQAPKETRPATQESPAPPPATPATPHPLTAEDVQGFFDAAVPMQLERENIAGAVVAVVKDGKVLFEKGYGYADVKTKKPVSPTDTLFRPGSVSKLFTWTAVMQLVEQGKLDLDKDVNQYLDFQVPQTYPQPITLRNLLTHTPGFEETDKDLFTEKQGDLLTLEQYLKKHVPRRIFPPGTTPAYSNYGAALAGYIVQRVSGQSFDDYLDQHIFQPLQMKHASFRQPLPAALAPLMSSGYKKGAGEAKGFEFVEVPPAGSLAASADDMTHFMLAHLQDGRYGDAQILKPETVAQMHARQEKTWSIPALNGMCLGFYEETRNGHRIIGHGGDTVYFHSDLHLIPDQGVGFFVSYNSAGNGDLSPRGPLFRAFLDRYFPYQLPEIQAPASAAADNQAVLGSYQTTRRCDACILRLAALMSETTFHAGKDGTIEADDLKSANGEPRRWKEIAPLVYRDVNDQAKIAFIRMPDGEMRMAANVNIVVDQRVPWYLRSKFLLFVLAGACVVFLLVLLLWPVGALVRRHYGQALPPAERGGLRLSVQLVCALDLLVVLGWVVFVSQISDNLGALSTHNDGWLHLLQVAQLIGVLGTLLALAAMFRAWLRQGLWWGARVYYTVVALACVGFAWITFVGHMLDFSLRY
jgi:CubicO group peptidase (beta-lactamase class C family)